MVERKSVKIFTDLLKLADILMGENGCPWDKEQTFSSLKKHIIEEAHELIEGIDNKDIPNIIEEMGDLLYTLIFLAKIAEKDKKFTMEDVCTQEHAKLIRRHPHIFGDEKAEDAEDVKKIWQNVKKQEKDSL